MRTALLSIVLALYGCSAGGGAPDGACAAGAHCIDGGDARSDGATPVDTVYDGGNPMLREVQAVEVVPADMVMMVPVGTTPTQAYQVLGRRYDGTMTGPLTGVWVLSSPALGAIDAASGIFTANGTAGGDVQVQVQVAGSTGTLSAMTMLTVVIESTVYAPVPGADAGVFTGVDTHFTTPGMTDPTRAPTLVYPLDGAMMPQNVYPADIQWINSNDGSAADETGSVGDFYRVRIHASHIDIVGYTTNYGPGFLNDWTVDAPSWHALAQTAVGEPATIAVDRWIAASGDVVTGNTVSVNFANGSVIGSVYYWDIAAGLSIRVDDGTNTRVEYMPTPPLATDGSHCVGCHSISADGRWFIGRLGGGENIGAVFDLTLDLTSNPPPTTFPLSTATPTSTRWWFASFNPDATRMMAEEDLWLEEIDPQTGAVIPLAAGSSALPATDSTHPAWSPDGHTIAFSANVNAWGGQYTAGDIGLIPVTGTDAFGPAMVIHTATSIPSPNPGTGNADSYPTWTPDSHWIAFAHGDGCRSEVNADALYIMQADGSNVVRMDNASGPATENDTFQPHCSPFDSGGYFWCSFLSRRDYGNAQAGTRGVVLSDATLGRQQIWVTAIADHPTPGVDPSRVAYWLPGQNTQSQNIAAYWAPRACRHDGAACDVGSECCSGMCAPGGDAGGPVCTPPPMTECRTEGQACGGSGCCPGLDCISNVCSVPPG